MSYFNSSIAEISLGAFANLPREIRDSIWAYALDLDTQPEEYYQGTPAYSLGAHSTTNLQNDSFTWPWQRTAILRTSRQIYTESLSIMISTNRFLFYLSPSSKNHRKEPINYTLRFQLARARYSDRDCSGNTISFGRNWDMLPKIRHVQILCWDLNISTIHSPSGVNGMSFYDYLHRVSKTLCGLHRLRSLEIKFHFSQRVLPRPKKEMGEEVELAARWLILPFLGLRELGRVSLWVGCHIFSDDRKRRDESVYMNLEPGYVEVFRRILMSGRDGDVPSVEGVRMMK